MKAETYVWQPKEWIQTFTGKQFWPLNPRHQDIDIRDIAHALSMKCRYSGHTKFFYSVAEHSVLVSHFVPPDLALWGLLHDASEAYLPDVPRPIKRHLVGFKEMEDRIMREVCVLLGMEWPEPPEVKRIDTAILADEMRQVMGPPPVDWELPESELGAIISGDAPATIEGIFLRRFWDLVGVNA